MRVNYTFRHRNWSNYLVDYANKKAEKLKRFETHKPFKVNVTFLDQKHERIVNLQVDCDGVLYIAKAITDDYFEAIDESFEKVLKQMERSHTKFKSGKMRRQKSRKAKEESLKRYASSRAA
ncbi:MAG: HPF/RaiA family ribosome-associated protein [Bdellovibrionaceae bacterium]|nr:HPF/RaiA family ribosome-associated protein [Pseudobdellovibrionaceae bacterium]